MSASDVSATCVVTGVGPPDVSVAWCFAADAKLLIAVDPVVMHSADVTVLCVRCNLHCSKWTRCRAVRYRNADAVGNSIAPIAVTVRVHPAKYVLFVSRTCNLFFGLHVIRPCGFTMCLFSCSVKHFALHSCALGRKLYKCHFLFTIPWTPRLLRDVLPNVGLQGINLLCSR